MSSLESLETLGNLPRYPVDGNFSDLLNWHLNFGTRAAGSPDSPGKRWGNKEFAAQCGCDDRSVRNWRNGREKPTYFYDRIEATLFGDNQLYSAWRIDLRSSYDNIPISKKGDSASIAHKIKVGCFNYPPLSTWSASEDTAARFSSCGPWTEIAEFVCDELGLEFKLYPITAADIVPESRKPNFDIITGLFKTDYRSQAYNFSSPLHRIGLNGICRTELPISKETLVEGKLRVVVQKGEVGWEYANTELKKIKENHNLTIIESSATFEVIDILLSGRYDVAITDELSCLKFLADQSAGGRYRLAFRRPLQLFDACLAVRKSVGVSMNKLNELLISERNKPDFLKKETLALQGFEEIIERCQLT